MSSKKFKGKYRIDSVRLKDYDYSSNGAYFITIVTKNRNHFFGKIENSKMILNEIGEIAQGFWNEIPKHFQFIILDEMVIMPNHIHGVLWINSDNDGDGEGDGDGVEALHATPLPGKNIKMSSISPKYGSLASVIRSFKSAVTRKSRLIGNHQFGWQTRFHDRIIRNNGELKRIRNYIIRNPEMWQRDRNNNDLWL